MKLTIVGCGDAFGAGGRLNTCIHVSSEQRSSNSEAIGQRKESSNSEAIGQRKESFLIDCGATALIGLRRYHLDPNEISTIFITHLHGDHFAGLAWLLIDGAHVSKRTAPLKVAGPRGIEERFIAATEALFPMATQVEPKFELSFFEYEEGKELKIDHVSVTPFEVNHFSGAPPYALRIVADGKTISYTGDTEWVEALVPASRGADLLIAECYQYDEKLKYHLDYTTLVRNVDRLGAKRVLLTHMSEAMLARSGDVDQNLFILAEDGMSIEL